jgi:transcription antitermination factor NusG
MSVSVIVSGICRSYRRTSAGTPFRHVLVTRRVVAAQLREQGVSTFLLMVTRTRRWTDRQKLVEFPLFSGYLFVHVAVSPEIRRIVLFVRGVAGFVAMRGEPLPIPDTQIDTVRGILAKNVRCSAPPF